MTSAHMDVAIASSSSTSNVRALSKAQERKATGYVEDQFMEINSAFKKRSEPSMSKLPTLTTYIAATQQLLAFILQIPPVDPSTSLRITFLLRLTGDVMNSVPGYPAEIKSLPQLLEFLDDLDHAWHAVLRAQVWDPTAGEGVDLVIPVENIDIHESKSIRSSPMSQTERTRLRSLLVMGTAEMEEWLTGLDVQGENYQLALERTGLQQNFDDLFSLTLAEMGSLGGAVNDPAGMEETC